MCLTMLYSVKIEGCIICNNAKIHEKASMKDCDVAGGYIVDKDSKFMLWI
jgi:translation initiation factor eIF-2B subunit gamma